MDVVLKAEGLSRVLDGEIPVTLVRDASVDIRTGEFTAITGPSGSGKSSLLYLLGLLDRPTAGRIFMQGQAVERMSDEQLAAVRLEHIGFIFQFHFLLPEFTALENVMMPMRKLGRLSQAAMIARAETLLTDLGLGDQMHKVPKKMSGGQCQRVAVARALANDPVLILADEPTGNLDTVSSHAVQEILKGLAHSQNRAVVAVTHDMEFASAADRRVHIVDGKVV
ncbi:MAG: ABC transporter ATP-binding protein [Alphaproteobacteria bacterium]